MSTARPLSHHRDTFDARDRRHLAITDGEINFLWSFIQGSIMIPETRNALLRGFGFCDRHAWVHLRVELAFRKRYLLGPVILYRALIEKAVEAIHAPQRVGWRSPMRRLQSAGPCLLCALNVNDLGSGASPRARLDRGRDSSALCAFATDLASLWRPTICAICANEARETSPTRCRPHLLTELKRQKSVDISWQQVTLQALSGGLARYQNSFVAGADKPRDQDRAALISAIGWCSGWRPLLALLSSSG
jgi:hypothetical protein